jgi:putative tricarboxylic transport membrane protein
MHKNEMIGGGLFVALGIFIFTVTLGFPPLDDNHPGPGLFPQILAILFIFFGGMVFYKGIKPKKGPEDPQEASVRYNYFGPIFVLLLIVGYMVFSNWLGFFITSVIVLSLMMLKLNVMVWKSLVIAVCLTVFVNFMFAKLLRVPLPPGLFWW